MKNESESPDESGVEIRARKVFDASVRELNANVRSRLTQARFAAVAQTEHQPASPLRRIWMPAAGLTAAALLAALIIVPKLNVTDHAVVTFASDDLPMLLDSDSEFIEDLDFYAWLDEEALLNDGAIVPVNTQGDPARS